MTKTDAPIIIRIRRQNGDDRGSRRWESFELTRRTWLTVADALDAIDADISWASECEWPACGVCTMVINGRAQPACATRVRDVAPRGKPLVLEPLGGFPIVRDLWVDRGRMRRDATRLRAWPEPHAPGAALELSARLPFTLCTRCGACLDACPETHQAASFAGPAAFGLYHAATLHGAAANPALLDAGGIADCGHALNCVEVCPESIPLDDALAQASQDTTRTFLASLLKRT